MRFTFAVISPMVHVFIYSYKTSTSLRNFCDRASEKCRSMQFLHLDLFFMNIFMQPNELF